jgi:hypothetical protein
VLIGVYFNHRNTSPSRNMQTIITKYHGPTNTKGARITAKSNAGTVSIGYPHEMNEREAHCEAACALMKKLGIGGSFISAELPGSMGWAHVSSAQRITA